MPRNDPTDNIVSFWQYGLVAAVTGVASATISLRVQGHVNMVANACVDPVPCSPSLPDRRVMSISGQHRTVHQI